MVKVMKTKETEMQITHNETFDCPEVLLTRGSSSVRMVMKKDDPNEADANVLDVQVGTYKDVKVMLAHFKQKHPSVKRIVNQVSNEKEMRALWGAFFFYQDVRTWEAHRTYLQMHGSIMLAWNRIV